MGNFCNSKLMCQDCGQLATYRAIYYISSTKFAPNQKIFSKIHVGICTEFQSLPDAMSQYFVKANLSRSSFEFVITPGIGMQKKNQVEFTFLGCDKCITSNVKSHFEYSAVGF